MRRDRRWFALTALAVLIALAATQAPTCTDAATRHCVD